MWTPRDIRTSLIDSVRMIIKSFPWSRGSLLLCRTPLCSSYMSYLLLTLEDSSLPHVNSTLESWEAPSCSPRGVILAGLFIPTLRNHTERIANHRYKRSTMYYWLHSKVLPPSFLNSLFFFFQFIADSCWFHRRLKYTVKCDTWNLSLWSVENVPLSVHVVAIESSQATYEM